MLHWIQMYWWTWCINLCSEGGVCIKKGYSFTFQLQTCLPLNTERTWKTFMKYVLNHSANATALTIVKSVSSIFLSKQPWQLIFILSLDHKTHACGKPLNHQYNWRLGLFKLLFLYVNTLIRVQNVIHSHYLIHTTYSLLRYSNISLTRRGVRKLPEEADHLFKITWQKYTLA